MKTRQHPDQMDFFAPLLAPPAAPVVAPALVAVRVAAILCGPSVELDERPTLPQMPSWPWAGDPDPTDRTYCLGMIEWLGSEIQALQGTMRHLEYRLAETDCPTWDDELSAAAEYLEAAEAEYAYWHRAYRTYHLQPAALAA